MLQLTKLIGGLHNITRQPTKLFHSEFIRNVLFLMSGNALAQCISIGASPLITRLFTPENFGILALFLSSSSLTGSVSTLCYDRAILLPKNSEDALALTLLSGLILFSMCVVLLMVILGFQPFLIALIAAPEFGRWIYFVPLAVFLEGIIRIFRYWHFRQKNFRLVALARTSESTVTAGLKIGFGFICGTWTGGLILGTLVGMAVCGMILLRDATSLLGAGVLESSSSLDLKKSFYQYKKFPLFATWNALIGHASRSAVVFVMSALFSTAVIGFYGLANRILRQPVSLLSDSISNVFFQKAAVAKVTQVDIAGTLLKAVLGLFSLGLIPFLVLGVFGRDIFRFLFGGNWEMAGQYAQIMAPWLFVVFIGGPGNVIYEVSEKQDIKLILNVLKGTLSISALIAGGFLSGDPRIALVCFVGINVVFEIVTLVLAGVFAKRSL